jgi:hypothetical protein
MNYNKIYNQIVERAQNRILEGYRENHHIIPKCLGGTEENNIVRLTAREHFLCHLLLCEIYPNNEKLKYALFLMAVGKRKIKPNHYIMSSRTYERLKLNHSLFLIGRQRTEETKQKISKSRLGKPRSKETKLKISEGKKGVKCRPYKIRKDKGLKHLINPKNKPGYKIGSKLSEEHKLNIKNNRKNCILSKIRSVIQKDINGNIIRIWNSIIEARKETGIKGIKDAVSQRIKTSGGYYWEYYK